MNGMTLIRCCLFGLLLSGCNVEQENLEEGTSAAQKPNILLIVADDMGFSDLGIYGSEINTPNLDRLARKGVRFADFHVAATCSTTRSMLLSGVDNHLNGLGGLDAAGTPKRNGPAGYEGYLNFDVIAFPSLLRAAGYHTYMAGKWHLGYSIETGPEARGFDKSFVMPGGAADHFSAKGVVSGLSEIPYRENGQPADLPADFYSSKFYTDKLIEYIKSDSESGKPFFAYAAYTAPHWPLQAPDEFIEKYDGVYDVGYDVIRENRIRKMSDLGLVHDVPASTPTSTMSRKWSDLDDGLKARESRHMQVYAAMVEALDFHIGRLVSFLESTDQLDNTVIIFLSDNGPEGNDPYVIKNNENWVPEEFDTKTGDLGRPGSFSSYGPGWAEVSAAPFRLYKTFPAEGGVRVPAFMVLPQSEQEGRLSRTFATVLDIAPTLLNIAGAEYPKRSAGGRNLPELQGRSMMSYLSGQTSVVHDDDYVMGWELFNRRAIRKENWKIVWIDSPYGPGKWTLYDLNKDPFELEDLSESHSMKLQKMIGHWEEYAAKNGVVISDYSGLKYGNINHHYDR